MDATAALSELLALSTQVVEVVIDGPGGAIEAVHAASEERGLSLAAAGASLLAEAATLRRSGPEVERVQVDLERGSLVAVRGGWQDDRRDDRPRADSRSRGLRPPNRAPSRRGGSRVRLLLLGAAAVAAWLVLRRRGGDARRVVVAWDDGSEVDLAAGTSMPERDRLLEIAEGVLP